VTRNLYVVAIPGGPGKIIEDLFDSNTRGIKLNGKSFNPSNKPINRATEYGKVRFAEYVQKEQDSIDFTGFKPLLANLESVIADHEAAVGGGASP